MSNHVGFAVPHPLANVRRQAGVAFGIGFLDQRPELMPLVAKIVERAAYLELQFNFAFYRVVGTAPATGFAILDVLRGRRQAVQVFEAAATKSFAGDELHMVMGVIGAFGSAMSRRDVIAHQLWGISDQLPDALLLIEPELYHNSLLAFDLATQRGEAPAIDAVRFDFRRIMVYREPDFIEIIDGLQQTFQAMYSLNGWLMAENLGVARDDIRAAICKMPVVLQRLAKAPGVNPN